MNENLEKAALLGGVAQIAAGIAGAPGLAGIVGGGIKMLGRAVGLGLGRTGSRFNGNGLRSQMSQRIYNAGRKVSLSGAKGEGAVERFLDKDFGSGLGIPMDASKLPGLAKLPLSVLGVNTKRPSVITPQRALVIGGNALGIKSVVDMVAPKAAPSPLPPESPTPDLPPGQPRLKYAAALYLASLED